MRKSTGSNDIAMGGKQMAIIDRTYGAPIRSHGLGMVFFGRRKKTKLLGPFGWFSVLCIASLAIGVTLALAT
jgi:hypothetical protein